MTLLTVWPYLLMIPALALGVALGWTLQLARQRRAAPPVASAPVARVRVGGRKALSPDARAEMDAVERQTVALNVAISRARQQLEDLGSEHDQLIEEITIRRTEIEEDRRTVDQLRQARQSRQEQMLEDIDAGGEELEMLERMHQNYTERITRLSQQVEDKLNELEVLRRSYGSTLEEIAQTREQIERQEGDLRRLVSRRAQLEQDIDHVQRQIAERNQTLHRVHEQQHERAPEGQFVPVSLKRAPRDSTPRSSGASGRVLRGLPDGRGRSGSEE
ncbi:MAG TPA: hypothetical protein VKY39_08070 [Aggregatilineales bacterium]|nr:hypothetical protein [Aggregatilineales bacterium]